MQVVLQRRAEVALRSLHEREKKRIARAIDMIADSDRRTLLQSGHVKKIAMPGPDLYVYKAGLKMRLILSFEFEEEVCVVEDILSHDAFTQLRWRRK